VNLRLVVLAVFGIAIAVVYLLQWLKSGPWLKTLPSWVWWALSPLLCLGLALSVNPLLGIPLLTFLIVGLLGLAVVQAGYETIVQHLPRIIGALADLLEAKVKDYGTYLQGPKPPDAPSIKQ